MSSVQPALATQPLWAQRPANTAETMHHREEDYYGYNQEEPRPRFENEHKSTPHLNSRGAEFESIRLATRIHEWYRDRVPDEELTELPAQKGTLRISNTDRAVQLLYLYDPEKDHRDLHGDYMVYEPSQSSSKWGSRPCSLAEIICEYDTEDEGRRSCQHDENHEHPFYQYKMYLDDGGRRRYVHTDTGDEQFYSQWQPGLQPTGTGMRLLILERTKQ